MGASTLVVPCDVASCPDGTGCPWRFHASTPPRGPSAIGAGSEDFWFAAGAWAGRASGWVWGRATSARTRTCLRRKSLTRALNSGTKEATALSVGISARTYSSPLIRRTGSTCNSFSDAPGALTRAITARQLARTEASGSSASATVTRLTGVSCATDGSEGSERDGVGSEGAPSEDPVLPAAEANGAEF